MTKTKTTIYHRRTPSFCYSFSHDWKYCP